MESSSHSTPLPLLLALDVQKRAYVKPKSSGWHIPSNSRSASKPAEALRDERSERYFLNLASSLNGCQCKAGCLGQEENEVIQENLKILLADDDDGERAQVKLILQQAYPSCVCVDTPSVVDALEACEQASFDCAIVDYKLTGQDGLAGISSLHERFPYLAIIMVTGQGDEMVATEAMKCGASDYMTKKRFSADSIRRSVENAVSKLTLMKTVAKQREELEVFSRVLVHDLKAPIHSVLGFAALIIDSIHEGNIETAAFYSARVSKSVERMNTLIDTLYRYTSAEGKVMFEPLEMEHVMTDTLLNLQNLVGERGARVTYGDLPVVTGTAQLTQLLQNLIGNGIKYSEAEIPLVHVDARPQAGNLWLFSVKDNGIGIPEKDFQQVFEPFHRLRSEAKYEGTGLGLATCKKIVERHGGSISCESKEGEGSTFFFTLRGA